MSTLLHKTVGNAVVVTLGTVAEAILQFLFVVIISRELGPAEYGFFGYVVSIFTITQVIVNWGLPVVAVREAAQRPKSESEIFVSMFRIRLGLSILFFVFGWLFGYLTETEPVRQACTGLIFVYLLFIPFDISPLLDARKQSKWDMVGKLSGRIAGLIALAIPWLLGVEVTVALAAAASSLVMVVYAVVGWQVGKKHGIELRLQGQSDDTLRLMKISSYVMWGNLMTTMYQYAQTIMLKWFSTEQETGYYSLTTRLAMPALMVRGILYRLLLPIISETAFDRENFIRRLEMIIPALALVFMPMVILGITLAEIVVVPIFGSEYSGAILPFQIALAHFAFSGFGAMFGTALFTTGDQRTITVGLTLGCTLGMVAAFLLIPKYGAIGGAFGMLTGELVSGLYPIPFLLKKYPLNVFGRLSKIFFSSLLSLVSFYAIRDYAGALNGLAFVVCFTVLAGGLWFSREITYERLNMLKKVLQRKS